MPSQKIPNRLPDVIHLVNRLLHPPFLDRIYLLQAYYHTKSGRAVINLYTNVKRPDLARLLHDFRREYADLVLHSIGGTRPFTTREALCLACRLLAQIPSGSRIHLIVQALDDTKGNYKYICAQYKIPLSTYYYEVNLHLKKPFLEFCKRRAS